MILKELAVGIARALYDRLRFISEAKKAFDAAPVWEPTPHRSSQRLVMVVALRLNGVLRGGVSMRLRTPIDAWDEDVYGQIEVRLPGMNRTLRVNPIEWRPRRYHDNPPNAPPAHRNQRLWDRWHPFDINAEYGMQGFDQSGCGIAVPLPTVPDTFSDYSTLCAEMRGPLRLSRTAVDSRPDMTRPDLEAIGSDVANALSRSHVRNEVIFVATSVTYPNGTGVSVKIECGRDGFAISDDGYAEVIAGDMGVISSLHRIAHGVAERAGIKHEHGAFAVDGVERNLLPIAVATIANASATAVERTLASLERARIKRSRDVFDRRLKEAFGDDVAFEVEYRGATGRRWAFSVGVKHHGMVERLFELVSPSIQAVGLANMKISDVRAVPEAPVVTAALIDYERQSRLSDLYYQMPAAWS